MTTTYTILAWQSSEAERRHLANCLMGSSYKLAPGGSSAFQEDVTALLLPVRQTEERSALTQIAYWRHRRRDLLIVVTSEDTLLVKAAIDAGADDFIAAPVRPERLCLTLNHLTEKANLKRQLHALANGKPMELAEQPKEYIHPMTDQQLTEKIRPLDQIERDAIEDAIRFCQGDVRKAAHFLNVSAATVYRRLKKWNTELSPA